MKTVQSNGHKSLPRQSPSPMIALHDPGSDGRNSGNRRIREVLLIGGAGFVGSVLARKLISCGYRVTIMDALVFGDESIRGLYGRPDFDVVRGDLRSVESIVRSVKSADAVVHLGGLVGDPACDLDERVTLEINLEATRTIAEASRGLGVQRLIFASSCSVYGLTQGEVDENSELSPVSVYARTKMDSEKLLLALDNEQFTATALRFGTFYGLSPRQRFDLVVNMLAAKATTEGEITIFGGSQWRPFLHVSDGADAVIRCLQAPKALIAGQVFNVGSDDENYTLVQVAQLVMELIPGTRVNYEDPQAVEADYRVSFRKIREQLGFVPDHTIADGVTEIQEAIASGAIDTYLDDRYSNIKTLAGMGDSELMRSRKLVPSLGLARS